MELVCASPPLDPLPKIHSPGQLGQGLTNYLIINIVSVLSSEVINIICIWSNFYSYL